MMVDKLILMVDCWLMVFSSCFGMIRVHRVHEPGILTVKPVPGDGVDLPTGS